MMKKIVPLLTLTLAIAASDSNAKGILGENVILSSIALSETDNTIPVVKSKAIGIQMNQSLNQNLDMRYGLSYGWNDFNDVKNVLGTISPTIYFPVNEMIKPYAQAALGFAMLTDVFQYTDGYFNYYDRETHFTYGYGLGVELNINQIYFNVGYGYSEIDTSETDGISLSAGYWISDQSSVFFGYSDLKINDVVDTSGITLGFAVAY